MVEKCHWRQQHDHRHHHDNRHHRHNHHHPQHRSHFSNSRYSIPFVMGLHQTSIKSISNYIRILHRGYYVEGDQRGEVIYNNTTMVIIMTNFVGPNPGWQGSNLITSPTPLPMPLPPRIEKGATRHYMLRGMGQMLRLILGIGKVLSMTIMTPPAFAPSKPSTPPPHPHPHITIPTPHVFRFVLLMGSERNYQTRISANLGSKYAKLV